MILDLEDKQTQAMVRTLVGSVPLCGCGTSEAMWLIVKAALGRAAESNDAKVGFYTGMTIVDRDGDKHTLPPLAVEFVAQVLNSHGVGLLEHGTAVGYSWLTPQGKVLLAFLGAQPNPDEWPEWVTSSTGDEIFEMPRDLLRIVCANAIR